MVSRGYGRKRRAARIRSDEKLKIDVRMRLSLHHGTGVLISLYWDIKPRGKPDLKKVRDRGRLANPTLNSDPVEQGSRTRKKGRNKKKKRT